MAETIPISIDDKEVIAALKNLTKSIGDFQRASDAGFKQATSSFNVFKGALAAQVVLDGVKALGGALKDLFNVIITDGIKAAQEEESALKSLNFALVSTGRLAKDSVKDFQEFSKVLSQTSGIQDDVIIQNAALLQSLSGLTNDGLKKATQAAVDLAAVTGKDLSTVTNAIAKAANGSTEALAKFGIQVEKGKTEAETFANALDKIQTRFGGAASQQVNTFSGALNKVSISFNDLLKELGKIFTQNAGIKSLFISLADGVNSLAKSVDDNRQSIIDFTNNGILFLFDTIIKGLPVLDFLNKSFIILQNTVSGTLSLVTGTISQLGIVIGSIGSKFTEAESGAGTFFRSLQDASQNVAGAAADQILTDIDDIKKAYNDPGVFSSFKQNLLDTQQSFSTAIDANTVKAEDAEKRRLDAIRNAAAEEQRIRQESFTAIDELVNERKAVQAEQEALEKELKIASEEEEFLRLEQNLGRRAAIEELATAQRLARDGKENEARQKLREIDRKAAEKDLQSLFDFEKNTNAGRAANFRSTLGTISTLQSSSSQELFAIGKAAALATATIDGIAAVQKALASAPPPFNFALAAIVGVASAANLAKIASAQPPSRQGGGLVPGPISDTDNTLINAAGGELVLNRRQQTDLFNSINQNRIGGGGSGTVINIQGNVIADDESQVNKLIERIQDQLEFRNATLSFG